MPEQVPEFRFGSVTLVPTERVLLRDGLPVALTPKAFDLLVYFAAHPGRLLTKDELMSAVWPDVVVEEANIAYHVFAIRKAIGDGAESEQLIETVPKQGYRFVAPVLREPEALEVPQLEAPRFETSEAKSAATTVQPRRTGVFGAVGLLLGSLLVAGVWVTREASPAQPVEHFREPPWHRPSTAGVWLSAPPSFQVSPDGRHLAAMTAGDDGVMRVSVRSWETATPRWLTGTESRLPSPLFWSPNSRLIAYDATDSGTLMAVSIAGGAPHTICHLPATVVGGSWSGAGVIIAGNAKTGGGLMRCPAEGGRAEPLTQAAPGEIHIFPSFLADERHFIYLRISRTDPEQSGIYVSALGADPAGGRRLFTTGFAASYVRATDGGPGLLVFGRDGALFAQRFDNAQLDVTGEAFQLASRIGSILDYPYFSVAESRLVYREPEPPLQLTWFDRDGVETGRLGAADRLAGLALSPHDDRVLVARHAPGNNVSQDLWLYDLTGNVRRQTTAPTLEFFPILATHDRFFYTAGGGETGIYGHTIGGGRVQLVKSDGWDVATDVSRDGRLLLFSRWGGSDTRMDVWMRDLHSTPAGDVRLIASDGDQEQARLSRDARFVAFVSNESGVNEVFVAHLTTDAVTGAPIVRDARPVSRGGGFAPRWRHDGRELFYLKTDGSVMAVAIHPGQAPAGAEPVRLFAVPGALPEWGVSGDGRFLFAVPTAPPASYDILRNWQSILVK